MAEGLGPQPHFTLGEDGRPFQNVSLTKGEAVAEILDIQLMVEIAYGTEPLFSATVPRFRRFAGDEGHRVLGQGLTPALALEDFHHKLFAVVVGEEDDDKVETVKAPPLERADPEIEP